MKELSIEEKAKRYDEALKEAVIAHKDKDRHLKATLKRIFPELKESEDEIIREAILNYMTIMWGNSQDDVCGVQVEDAIAWLEKQSEQKLADKVEPKFKVGCWVMYCGKPYQITGLRNDTFTLTSCDGSYFFNNVKSTYEPVFHLWTIQDAKDGDVLSDGTTIFMFKDLLSDGSVISHCDYDTDTGESDAFCPSSVNLICSKITPATKEQRDTLEKAMADAGYTFDFDKKELRKIEQNPAWSEEDKNNFLFLTSIIEECFKDKEKITLCGDTACANFTKEDVIDRLKFLKDRYTWKPSDEQMTQLKKYCLDNRPLTSLYEQLKKLK